MTSRRSSVPGPRHRVAGGFLGLLAGALALGIAQLVAGALGGESSPMIAVGGAVIDATPPWLKDFAIRTFGANDKLALLIGIGVVLAIAAIVLGMMSIRRPNVGIVGLLVLGSIGLVAALTRPSAGVEAAIPSVAGTAAGIVAFRFLRRSLGPAGPSSPGSPSATGAQYMPGTLDRRRFVVSGMYAVVVAGVSGVAGQYLVRRSAASVSRSSVRIPGPVSAAPPLTEGADLGIAGVGPFFTSNARFYRVDTALLTPAVNADGWQLRVHGMVERELTLGYEQLLSRGLIERDITLACVSNEVGGDLIGNARWTGAPLEAILREAGVDPRADQLVSRSADGFTAGTPTAATTDGRDSMLAVSMNGEALPLAHGFPVRMIVPGLYGYVSATKWLVDLELTTFDAYDAYWIQRGWAQQAPIKTQSRIDTPRSGADLGAGEVAVAGVAWAQHRGIGRVEVRIDDGAWQEADLAAEDSDDTWRQWVYRWTATSGRHTLQVRATDGKGETQTDELAPPAPDGATGYHTIEITVS